MTEGAFEVPVVIPPTAPDVMVVIADVVRSVIQPQPLEEDDTEGIYWALQGQPWSNGDETFFRIFGDLGSTTDRAFLGVTSVVALAFRGIDLPPVDEWTDEMSDEYLTIYGPWASHVLWDISQSRARALAVQSFIPGPPTPTTTPEPLLRLAADTRDDD